MLRLFFTPLIDLAYSEENDHFEMNEKKIRITKTYESLYEENKGKNPNYLDSIDLVNLTSFLPDEMKSHILDYLGFFSERPLILSAKNCPWSFSDTYFNRLKETCFSITEENNEKNYIFLKKRINNKISPIVYLNNYRKIGAGNNEKDKTELVSTLYLKEIDGDSIFFLKNILSRKEVLEFIIHKSSRKFFCLHFHSIHQEYFEDFIYSILPVLSQLTHIHLYTNTSKNAISKAQLTVLFLNKIMKQNKLYCVDLVDKIFFIKNEEQTLISLCKKLSFFLENPESFIDFLERDLQCAP